MTPSRPCPWLRTIGPGSHFVTPELRDRLAQLFDILPQTRLIELETDAGAVSVSHNWPSDRMEAVSGVEADIAALPGIAHLTLFQAA